VYLNFNLKLLGLYITAATITGDRMIDQNSCSHFCVNKKRKASIENHTKQQNLQTSQHGFI